MDPVALELANALVGNRSGEAALELTVLGPEIEFECAALVAICGAHFDATLAGRALPLNRPVLVEKSSSLRSGRALVGSRAYLAVAGGIQTPPVLGSRSTYLPAKFGGLEGRQLRAGDVLPLVPDAEDWPKRFSNLNGTRTLQVSRRLPGPRRRRRCPSGSRS
jgi:antagonist of KipI